jgi:hypothetical protein
MDSATNRQKEDNIVITGITSSVYPPPDPAQRKIWLRKIVDDVIKSVAPDFTGQIVFVNQGKSNGKMIPLVEVKLDTVENANIIRKAFAEKKKSGADLGRLFIANSVNLATRVRVDILKALARKVSDLNLIAYAVPFISRPVMQIRSKESGRSSEARSFSFTDAVAKYGHLLKHQQQQHQHQQEQPERVPPRAGGSRKRSRDDEEEDDVTDWSRVSPPSARGRGRGHRSGYKPPWRGNSYYRR